jgi:hypothetical protein
VLEGGLGLFFVRVKGGALHRRRLKCCLALALKRAAQLDSARLKGVMRRLSRGV